MLSLIQNWSLLTIYHQNLINNLNPLLHRYTFIAWVNSIDPDQPTHPCCLIRISAVRFLIDLVISDQKANSADPDQMAQMIWIYTQFAMQ
jgi:hypothetical protein